MLVKARNGDTFHYYSQLFHIPESLIIDSNPNIPSSNLQIGSEIAIPGYYLKPYKVQQDDTLFMISQSNNIAVDALYLANPTIDSKNLQIGEKILIPTRVTQSIVSLEKKYNFQQFQSDLKSLLDIYPFIQKRVIGKSVLNNPLYEIILGKGERVVHLNGSFHANEWITSLILMRILNEFLISLTNQQPIREINPLSLYEKNLLSIVPMVNPDGVDLVINGPTDLIKDDVTKINKGSNDFTHWKANIRGIDLNNQFPANWEIEKERKIPKQPASRDYPGDFPMTEPEVTAMAKLAGDRNIDCMIALHTQGREIYWGYENYEPPESEELVKEFERESGYLAVRYIDSHAGYKDWFLQTYRKPGFTVELGKGINPLPLSLAPSIYEEALGIFLASLKP